MSVARTSEINNPVIPAEPNSVKRALEESISSKLLQRNSSMYSNDEEHDKTEIERRRRNIKTKT